MLKESANEASTNVCAIDFINLKFIANYFQL